jgi:hypothetical protein
MPEGWLAIAPPQHAPVLLPPCSAFLGRAPLLIVLGCRPYSGRPRLVVSASCSHKALLSPSSSGYTLASSSPLSPCSLMLCRACSCAQRAQPAPCRVPAELLRTAPYRGFLFLRAEIACSFPSSSFFPARSSSLLGAREALCSPSNRLLAVRTDEISSPCVLASAAADLAIKFTSAPCSAHFVVGNFSTPQIRAACPVCARSSSIGFRACSRLLSSRRTRYPLLNLTSPARPRYNPVVVRASPRNPKNRVKTKLAEWYSPSTRQSSNILRDSSLVRQNYLAKEKIFIN